MEAHGRAHQKKKERAKSQNGKCFYCHLRLGEDLTWEHLVPQSHGGCSRHRNLRIAHMKCNCIVAALPVQAKLILSDIGAKYGSDAFFLGVDKIMPHADGILAILGSWKRVRRMRSQDFAKLAPSIQNAFLEAERIAIKLAEKERAAIAYHQGREYVPGLIANDLGPVSALAA